MTLKGCLGVYSLLASLLVLFCATPELSAAPAQSASAATRKARAAVTRKPVAARSAPAKKPPTAKAVSAPAFTLHKLGEGAPVVLIVGGIQGDEPGGFSAASLLATHYTVQSGAVWVVPNLNFPSILKRSRGTEGDMNRKFANLDASDPDFAAVRAMQGLIRTPGLQLVLNLHDGSGFYRPTRVSDERNPQRWGQCVIIDRSAMEHARGDLEKRGEDVLREVNRALITPDHTLYLKNTLTHKGNPEMEKSLSWFAVLNNVPAFGVEASKALTTDVRAYYHLQLIEAFLKQSGVSFTRQFQLTPKAVAQALGSDLHIRFAEGRSTLPLENVRPRQVGTLPLPRDAATRYTVSKPIMAATVEKGEMVLHYGNRVLSRFKVEWMDVDTSIDSMGVLVDGKLREVRFGEVVTVKSDFTVKEKKGFRVNAIGATEGNDESDILFRRSNFQPRFSLDPAGYVYRVEVYKDKKFAGMFLVSFAGAPTPPLNTLPAVAGRETRFGM